MDACMPSSTPIACNIVAIPDAERPRYFALRAQVLAAVEAVTDIDDGYALHVRADREMLIALAEWIAFERLCCPFLRFRLVIEGEAPVRLDLLGDEEVKGFLREEFAMLKSTRLVSP